MDENSTAVPGGGLPEHLGHEVHRHRVEAGERLVEHDDVGVVHESGGELHPLLVAEAELLQIVASARSATPRRCVQSGRRGARRRPSCPCSRAK